MNVTMNHGGPTRESQKTRSIETSNMILIINQKTLNPSSKISGRLDLSHHPNMQSSGRTNTATCCRRTIGNKKGESTILIKRLQIKHCRSLYSSNVSIFIASQSIIAKEKKHTKTNGLVWWCGGTNRPRLRCSSIAAWAAQTAPARVDTRRQTVPAVLPLATTRTSPVDRMHYRLDS